MIDYSINYNRRTTEVTISGQVELYSSCGVLGFTHPGVCSYGVLGNALLGIVKSENRVGKHTVKPN